MFRSHRTVGRAKPPARHFDIAQALRGVPAVRLWRATAHPSVRFVSVLVSAFCPPYDSARAEHALVSTASAFVMPGQSPSKTGVNALMPGHPRLSCLPPRRGWPEQV